MTPPRPTRRRYFLTRADRREIGGVALLAAVTVAVLGLVDVLPLAGALIAAVGGALLGAGVTLLVIRLRARESGFRISVVAPMAAISIGIAGIVGNVALSGWLDLT
jgi:hypothetical protein